MVVILNLLVSRVNICVVCGLLLGGSVDFKKKRKGGCGGKRPSNYLVECRGELPEYSLPVGHTESNTGMRVPTKVLYQNGLCFQISGVLISQF
jgi:hypothetical protein